MFWPVTYLVFFGFSFKLSFIYEVLLLESMCLVIPEIPAHAAASFVSYCVVNEIVAGNTQYICHSVEVNVS